MGAVLILIVVLAVCVYAMVNPADVVEGVRVIWTATREHPEETLVSVAPLVAVLAVLWFALKMTFGRRRHVVYPSSQVGSASVQRPIGDESHPQLERMARHEAAHTLAAYLLGATHLTADVHLVGERGGRATYQHGTEGAVWDQAYDDLVIGFAAQVIDHRNGQFDAGSMADMASQQRRMMVILSAGKQPHKHAGPLTVEALIASSRTEAERLLTQHQDELEEITAALVAERELDDDEIREIIASPVETR